MEPHLQYIRKTADPTRGYTVVRPTHPSTIFWLSKYHNYNISAVMRFAIRVVCILSFKPLSVSSNSLPREAVIVSHQ